MQSFIKKVDYCDVKDKYSDKMYQNFYIFLQEITNNQLWDEQKLNFYSEKKNKFEQEYENAEWIIENFSINYELIYSENNEISIKNQINYLKYMIYFLDICIMIKTFKKNNEENNINISDLSIKEDLIVIEDFYNYLKENSYYEQNNIDNTEQKNHLSGMYDFLRTKYKEFKEF